MRHVSGRPDELVVPPPWKRHVPMRDGGTRATESIQLARLPKRLMRHCSPPRFSASQATDSVCPVAGLMCSSST